MKVRNIYWTNLAIQVKKFWDPNDEITEIGVVQEPNSTCELCDHHPITAVHILKNIRTSQTRRVGRECAVNYKVVIDKPNLFRHISKWGPERGFYEREDEYSIQQAKEYEEEIAKQEAWKRQNAHLIEEAQKIAQSIWNLSQQFQEPDFILYLCNSIVPLLSEKEYQKGLRKFGEEIEVLDRDDIIPF